MGIGKRGPRRTSRRSKSPLYRNSPKSLYRKAKEGSFFFYFLFPPPFSSFLFPSPSSSPSSLSPSKVTSYTTSPTSTRGKRVTIRKEISFYYRLKGLAFGYLFYLI